MKKFMAVAALVAITVAASAQTVIPLYKKVPNSKKSDVQEKSDSTSARGKVSNVVNPTITAYLPEKDKANGTAVVICPGGGYSYLVVNGEGKDIAQQFVKNGIAAFVLKYRLPSDAIMENREIGPLQDAQQAIKIVRERAAEWNIDTAKVGIAGFSAGGHLASTLSTHYKKAVIENNNNTNLRPSFSILVYPVITFQDSILHKGSKKALIGENASVEKVREYSNEMQVTPNTPMAFLVHCTDDKVVPVVNSVNYYLALHKNNVRAELHVYETGGHGFGLNNKTTTDQWFDRCLNWMRVNKLL
ncbi:alpha/beta hydrolase [Mucilaginibacter ginkgonis]|uniref:Alpha/beta hydrolase n=1 Tax=Mucilaginibacter ginkgonis TaxID=2682091 RepID=A0A6I4HYL5_9SPHI|nr:alpha/beta hydrolase [Mucilaginibacter ginkgonis]QQL50303.1 alpha/beta hydrolase [Mucilaginibacter ginkgonis]